jgi:hypothetical protein
MVKLERILKGRKMITKFKKLLPLAALVIAIIAGTVVSCDTDATVASRNLSKAADQFEIARRIVFYNGITGDYMLTVEGRCSINVDGVDHQLELTCKTENGEYLKHFLGLSDNVTYFAEQLQSAKVSASRYRVVFKPLTIIPDIDVVK